MEAAQRVIDARTRLAMCHPMSPAWRDLAVLAEHEWQNLVLCCTNPVRAASLLQEMAQ
jgi:hypothetical protein